MDKINIFNVDSLAAKAGVSRRAIHYYLQRGLLMPPEGGGRGSHYTQEHLVRIKELQKLSEQGVPLSRIKEFFEHGKKLPIENAIRFNKPIEVQPETWNHYSIIDGIELHIRNDVLSAPLKQELLERIAVEVKRALSPTQKEDSHE